MFYLPPGALRDVTLPKRLLVSCTSDLHGDTRLVGAKRVQGAQDESAVRVRTELLNALARTNPEFSQHLWLRAR